MKNIPKLPFFSIVNIVVISLSFFIFAPEYTLIQFINIVFYVFSICLVVFLFLHIKKGGIFDGLSFGMHRFRSMMSKDVDDIDSWKEKKSPSQKVNKTFYSTLKVQVLFQLILLAILLFIYYLN